MQSDNLLLVLLFFLTNKYETRLYRKVFYGNYFAVMHIAIIAWWQSKERTISLKSAQLFVKYLDKNKHTYSLFVFPEQKEEFLSQASSIDCVIPVIHGHWWEDGSLTALCDRLTIPVCFTSSDVHALCFNKYKCSVLVESQWISIPEQYLLSKDSVVEDSIEKDFFPVFVKPLTGWSSIDNKICSNYQELQEIVEKISTYDQALVQQFLWSPSKREFTISLMGDYDKAITILWITEIITQKAFFDYDAKYHLDKTKEVIPAIITQKLQTLIEQISLKIYRYCKITSLARIDFIWQNETLYFLEVNTIPGFTESSFFPKALEYQKISFTDFIENLLQESMT